MSRPRASNDQDTPLKYQEPLSLRSSGTQGLAARVLYHAREPFLHVLAQPVVGEHLCDLRSSGAPLGMPWAIEAL
jgi:hypothetical protein